MTRGRADLYGASGGKVRDEGVGLAPGALQYREQVRDHDPEAVRTILVSSRFFSTEEVDVAVELVQERLSAGIKSGYHFIFAERESEVLGYSCFGPIPLTVSSYDLYWIAVSELYRGLGIGGELLRRTEGRVRELGGDRLYIETSSRSQYDPTRSFYERHGYRAEAVMENFYAPGDHKVVYVKRIGTRGYGGRDGS